MKKKYVKITNLGTANRLFLEIIGFGNKRDKNLENSVSVGQFHSGFKFATPSAIRLGLDVAASSIDEWGEFILRFETEDLSCSHRGQEISDKILIYNYSDGRRVKSSVSLNAFPDWGKPLAEDSNNFYNILREYIANARDEDEHFTIETGVMEIRQAPSFCTSLYIEENRQILELLKNSPAYFKFLEDVKPVFQVAGLGFIYPKSKKGSIRFFSQGYLVGCKKEDMFEKSLYDYDAVGKELVSETRIIKNQDQFDKKIGRLFMEIKSEDLLKELMIFACEHTFSYEAKVFSLIEEKEMLPQWRALCLIIWNLEFGGDALLSSGDAKIDAEAKARGFKVKKVGFRMACFFKHLGIMDAKEKLAEIMEKLQFRVFTLEEDEKIQKVIADYLEPLDHYNQSLPQFTMGALVDPSGKNRGMAPDFSGIYIEEKCFSEDEYVLLHVLVHELRHCNSKITDGDYRKFMYCADQEIVYLLGCVRLLRLALRHAGIDPTSIGDVFKK
ncbi:MAG: hypothetical protein WC459_01795 [Patescibacteria group bacterium]